MYNYISVSSINWLYALKCTPASLLLLLLLVLLCLRLGFLSIVCWSCTTWIPHHLLPRHIAFVLYESLCLHHHHRPFLWTFLLSTGSPVQIVCNSSASTVRPQQGKSVLCVYVCVSCIYLCLNPCWCLHYLRISAKLLLIASTWLTALARWLSKHGA